MQETIKTCDRCGKSSSTKDENPWKLITVGVFRSDLARGSSWGNDVGVVWRREGGRMQQDWCPNCVTEMGLDADPPQPQKTEQPKPPPTIDDIIKELIVNEVDERINNQ